MTSLAYRSMNSTLDTMEQERDRQDAEWYRNLPEKEKAEPSYYWHIEHKPKRSWRFLTDFWGSERAMAEFWSKHYGTKPGYRLRCFDLHITENKGERQ